MGSFVIGERPRIARTTLFTETVLAVVVASSSPTEPAAVLTEMRELFPLEKMDEQQVSAAIARLVKNKRLEQVDGKTRASESQISKLGNVGVKARQAYTDLLDHIIDHCHKQHGLNDAQRGFLERNVRRATVGLFRSIGPIEQAQSFEGVPVYAQPDMRTALSQDVGDQIGRSALLAFADYVRDQENWDSLMPFVRSYSALSLRNLDPMGRRWQQVALSRASIALDTDAVLTLVIDDHPEHEALKAAVKAFVAAEVTIVVTPSVLHEVAGHIGRADTTYKRFHTSLLRLSPAVVEGTVWHAVVSGYYYACTINGYEGNWPEYWRRYHNPDDPIDYIRKMLSAHVEYMVADLEDIPSSWLNDFEKLSKYLLVEKEHERQKAKFRRQEDMENRVRDDVRMAMHLANYESEKGDSKARGYLASRDRAFVKLENHQLWPPKQKIHIPTQSLLELAEFVCGDILPDDQFASLLFNPVLTAAASAMESEIIAMAGVGIDLHDTYLTQLEYDLSHGLLEHVRALVDPATPEDAQEAIPRLLSDAATYGYPIDKRVQQVLDQNPMLLEELKKEKARVRELEEGLQRVAEQTAGESKKAKTRANRALAELGVEIQDAANPEKDRN